MEYRDRFTPDQWQQLLDTPALVGAAVMVCSGSGMGTVKEAFALSRSLLDVPAELEANALVRGVVEARQQGEVKSNDWQAGYQDLHVDEFEREVLDQCASLARMLAEVSDPQEADGFKDWVLGVGERVAAAASEHGFFGFGGDRISIEEQRLLREIKSALAMRSS